MLMLQQTWPTQSKKCIGLLLLEIISISSKIVMDHTLSKNKKVAMVDILVLAAQVTTQKYIKKALYHQPRNGTY